MARHNYRRLRHCDRVTDEATSVLARFCPKLHTIDLTGCTQVTDVGIRAIAVGCPLQKTMYVDYCPISEEGVHELIRYCPLLIHLSLSSPSMALISSPKLTLLKNDDRLGMAAGVGYDHSDCNSDEDDYLHAFGDSFDDYDLDNYLHAAQSS